MNKIQLGLMDAWEMLGEDYPDEKDIEIIDKAAQLQEWKEDQRAIWEDQQEAWEQNKKELNGEE